MRKRYATYRNRETGKTASVHRRVACEMLGRQLMPGEVVHHRDGDSMNNAPENLLVLPSQSYHAHIEYRLRRERCGQPMLFPELLEPVRLRRSGTLFDMLLLWIR